MDLKPRSVGCRCAPAIRFGASGARKCSNSDPIRPMHCSQVRIYDSLGTCHTNNLSLPFQFMRT